MEIRNWKIDYTAYKDRNDCPQDIQNAITAATAATQSSYAPYSQFYVGAVLELEDGTQISGSNQENASYPLGFCAERTALAAKVAIAPNKKINSIAITVRSALKMVDTPAAPCGICRQVLLEAELSQHQEIKIILTGSTGEVLIFNSVKDIMPFYFGPDDL